MILSKKELEKYPIIGSGAQGNIYQISKDTVAKVMSENMNLELLRKMRKLSLQQFVSPIEEIYDENGIVYSMLYNYIATKEYSNILDLIGHHLKHNINILLDDIHLLSEARILIRDLIPKNSLCFESKIYVVDFDLYEFAGTNLSMEMIEKLNNEKLEQYLKNLWIMALVKLGIDRREIKYHPEYFERNYVKSIENKMFQDETIKDYIKRKKLFIK